MSILAIIGFILAFLNPVIGGVLIGYIVWHSSPYIGFQIIVLSFTMLSLYGIAFIIWVIKKFERMEKRIKLIKGEPKVDRR
jgi:MFS family permease